MPWNESVALVIGRLNGRDVGVRDEAVAVAAAVPRVGDLGDGTGSAIDHAALEVLGGEFGREPRIVEELPRRDVGPQGRRVRPDDLPRPEGASGAAAPALLKIGVVVRAGGLVSCSTAERPELTAGA